jgi:hypothetical protein
LKFPHVAAGREKIFLYGSYIRFRQTIGVNPTAVTIPTTLMQQGNFQELLPTANGGIGNFRTAPTIKSMTPPRKRPARHITVVLCLAAISMATARALSLPERNQSRQSGVGHCSPRQCHPGQ